MYLLYIMFIGGILFSVLKNVVVVEDGIKLGGEKGAELVYSYSSFEGDIDYKLEGVRLCLYERMVRYRVLKMSDWVVHLYQ